MARRSYTYLPQTTDAVRVLGLQVAAARRRQRRTAREISERAGIDPKTLHRVEVGDPTVAIGTAFEVAALVGVDLFGVAPATLPDLASRLTDRLALLPRRVVEPAGTADDDF